MKKAKQTNEPTPREQAEFIMQATEDGRIPDFVSSAIYSALAEANRRLRVGNWPTDDDREQDIEFFAAVIGAGGRTFSFHDSPSDEIAFHMAALLNRRETPEAVKAALRDAICAMGDGFDSADVLAVIIRQHTEQLEADEARAIYVAEIDDHLRRLSGDTLPS